MGKTLQSEYGIRCQYPCGQNPCIFLRFCYNRGTRMGEKQVFPEWLDVDTEILAEEISDVEVDLLHNCEEYHRLYEEKYKLLEAHPNLYEMWDRGTPSALTVEESGVVIQLNLLEQKMRTIRDEAVFLLGRKNAYMFMRSMGLV